MKTSHMPVRICSGHNRVFLLANTYAFLHTYKIDLSNYLVSLGFNVSWVYPRHTYINKLDVDPGISLVPIDVHRRGFFAFVRLVLIYRSYFTSSSSTRFDKYLFHTALPNLAVIFAYLTCPFWAKIKPTYALFISGFGPSRIRDSLRYRLAARIYIGFLRRATNFSNFKVFTLNEDDFNIVKDFKASRRVFLIREAHIPYSELINGKLIADERLKQLATRQNLRIGYIGRLMYEKGIFDLILTTRQINDICPHFTFSVCGSSDGTSSSISAEELSSLGIFSFIGQISYSSFFKEIDILIFPSYREGHPQYLLRSLAYGVVSIVYPVPGSTVDIIDDYNGVITKGVGSSYLISSLLYLYNNREKLISLSKNSLQYSANISVNSRLHEITDALDFPK
jgi:glycosyltransferase involved in cell wall biosynthesis